MPAPLPSKSCVACGRVITWRKKWERSWDGVKYCSNACRRSRPGATDEAIEHAIIALLNRRPSGATICPSEAARVVAGDVESEWPSLMERTRRAANRLAARDAIEITQGGRVVDPSHARGPIRLRLRR